MASDFDWYLRVMFGAGRAVLALAAVGGLALAGAAGWAVGRAAGWW